MGMILAQYLVWLLLVTHAAASSLTCRAVISKVQPISELKLVSSEISGYLKLEMISIYKQDARIQPKLRLGMVVLFINASYMGS